MVSREDGQRKKLEAHERPTDQNITGRDNVNGLDRSHYGKRWKGMGNAIGHRLHSRVPDTEQTCQSDNGEKCKWIGRKENWKPLVSSHQLQVAGEDQKYAYNNNNNNNQTRVMGQTGQT